MKACVYVLASTACGGPPSDTNRGSDGPLPAPAAEGVQSAIPPEEPAALEAVLHYESEAERELFQTPVPLDSVERARSERKSLEGEIRAPQVFSNTDLAQISSTWFKRGTGVLIQNATDHTISSTIHFFSGSSAECTHSTARRDIAPRASIAPSPKVVDGCLFDHATIHHYDEFNLVLKVESIESGAGLE